MPESCGILCCVADRRHWNSELRSHRVARTGVWIGAVLMFVGGVMTLAGQSEAATYPIGVGAASACVLIVAAYLTERRERDAERRARPPAQ